MCLLSVCVISLVLTSKSFELQQTRFKPIYAQRPIKRTLTNSVDPDQTPQNAASDQDLHCLRLLQTFFLKHGNFKNLPDAHSIGKGPSQKAEESTRHK